MGPVVTHSTFGESESLDGENRLKFIQQVSVDLCRADSLLDLAGVALSRCLAASGANAGCVSLLNRIDVSYTAVHCHGYPQGLIAAYQTYTYDAQLPIADVVRSGAPLYIDTVAERNHHYPHLVQYGKAIGLGAMVALPLFVNGHALGGLMLNFALDRQFSPVERAFMATIAQVCAQAMGRQQEIDERRKAEAALKDSEARKAAILEVALDCIITIDASGRVVDWNPAAERTFGWAAGNVLGKVLADLIIPEALREAHNRGLTHYLTTGEGPLLFKRIEVNGVHADGTEFPIELTILPIQLEHRVLFTAYVRDIGPRKVALAQQRAFVRDVLMSVTDGKLRICSDAAELPKPMSVFGPDFKLSRHEGLVDLRHVANDAVRLLGYSEDRVQDLATAVSEAATNAITHGGGGEGQVFIDETSRAVQVRIADHGQGIAFEDLPHAALARGFSTKTSLGHGLKIMTETVDRVFLLTSSTGTTVVLEQDAVRPLPIWLT